jgi:hypothetical protein
MTIARRQVRNEAISVVWEPSRDDVFFKIVDGLFPAVFLCGAGVLLATYDPSDDTEPPTEFPRTAERATQVTCPKSLTA